MYKRNVILSAVLISISALAPAADVRAETQIFIEADALKGIEETAVGIGKVCKLANLSDVTDAEDVIIVAGRLSDKHIAPLVEASGIKTDANWIGDQGFYIKRLKDGKILITANTHVGVLYGLMELRDRIADDGPDVLKQKFDIKDRPVFEVRGGEVRLRANFTSFWATEPYYRTMPNRNA